jgi:hypothetical protein
MLDMKNNYEIKYFDNRWHVFRKGHEIPIPRADYGSKVEAELGLEKGIKETNKESYEN